MATVLSTTPPLAAASPAPAASKVQVAIWPIVIVMYATLLPREVRITLGELYFFIDRIALIAVLPWMLRKIFDGAIRLVLPDFLVLLMAAWEVAAMIRSLGLIDGLQNGGSTALDATAGYFLARISFRSLDDIRRALLLLVPGFALAGALIVIESVTGRLIVRPAFASIFGSLAYSGGTDVVTERLEGNLRLGLLRGLGPFQHPILGGLQMATLLPLYWFTGLRGWPRVIGTASALTALFTISSAAIIALVLGVAMITYDIVSRHVRELSWPVFTMLAIVGVLLVEAASGSGVIGLIVRFATLDSSTAYYRLLIWEFGSASVMKSPWFGIGLAGYDRPVWMSSSSVDNHWLLWAMRYGLVPAVALFMACITALLALGRSASATRGPDAAFFRGIAMCLAIMIIMMWTVTLQGGTLVWFTLLLGAAVACAQQAYRRPLARAPKRA